MRKLFLALLLCCGLVVYVGCDASSDSEGPVGEDPNPEGAPEEDIMGDYEKQGIDPSGGRQ